MKKPINQAYQLLFIVSLILLLAEGGFIGNFVSHHHEKLPNRCTGFANHFEHSHAHNTDDVFFIDNYQLKSGNTFIAIEFKSSSCQIIEDQYFTCIWQPPRYT